ncbi:hypothetical protein VSR17_16765 [Cupriavidus taiwanensis]|uniref:hypothetical protein n=1 Tax=Cupriavidus taiwanensis TaxID=164546 RepID=UPI000E10E208|nr:hypothetical protein [Cupriavidus taiwanensis]SOY48771.1 conserved hypothetical protein [Cupriavidus taiwanensis]SOY48833.1 conserved hypothetical protein [Cupriavidus taiwanensis]SOY83172.1 conserved hypothetical protein [Cupriavidus taiwanensis]SOZ56836.1 conserved hypothetical protein [Cupriavidus taiwanensis]SOZ79019.1 conserved hypothetical protein [Cupriavidus taiwanensis]
MPSPATRRRTPPPTIPQPGIQRAYALIEALGALSIVLAGLLPMAVVGTSGLGWLRELERLAQATRSAADDAELGRCATPLVAVAAIVPWPDAGGCLPGWATWGRP